MIRLFFLLSIAVVISFACKKKVTIEEQPVVENADSVATEEEAMTGNCYMAVSGQDTILIQMVNENNTVVGQLHYRYLEKDKSGGTIFGVMRGDTLVADYKFMAEGKESEREVAFLKRGEEFIEGYGEIVDKEGRKVFRDISLLKFEGWPMKPVDCAMLTWYFKK